MIVRPVEIWAGELCLREGLIVESSWPNSRRHLRIRLGSKAQPAARSSTLGHRMSVYTIRTGGLPAVVTLAQVSADDQGDFHSTYSRRLWETIISTYLFGPTIRSTLGDHTESINR